MKKFLTIHQSIAIVLIGAALSLLVGYGIVFLKISNDHTVFFPASSELLEEKHIHDSLFETYDNIYIAVEKQGGTVFTKQGISLLRDITQTVQKIGAVVTVESITAYPRISAGISGVKTTPLISDDFFTLSKSKRDAVIQELRISPLTKYWLCSQDGSMAAVNMLVPDTLPSIQQQDLVRQIYSFTDSLDTQYRDFSIYVTGSIVIDNAFSLAGFKDLQFLLPIMFCLMAGILLYYVKNWFAVSALGIVVLFANVCTMGILGWLKVELSPPSSVIPLVVTAVCIAGTIHILMGVFHDMKKGESKDGAIYKTFSFHVKPLTITSLTTIAGFLCLNFSTVPPFKTLGNGGALGVAISYLGTFSILPALLTLLPVKGRGREKSQFRFPTEIVRMTFSPPPIIIGILVLLAAISLTGLLRLDFNDIFEHYFNESYRFRKANDRIVKKMAGLDYFSYAIKKADLSDSAFIGKLAQCTNSIEKKKEVKQVLSYPVLLKKVSHDLYGHSMDSTPELSSLVSLHRLVKRFGSQQDFFQKAFWDSSGQWSRIFVRLSMVDARSLRKCDTQMREMIQQQFGSSTYHLGSEPLLFAYLAKDNVESMLWSFAASLLFITVVMLVVARNWVIGLLGASLNVIPLLVGFGFWGLFFKTASMGMSIVAPLTIGVIVDDTVHIIMAYLRGKRIKKLTDREAVVFALHHKAPAAVVTTLVLGVGFGLLGLSGFLPTAELGIMTLIILFAALGADIFLFPLIMNGIRKKNASETFK